jgi:hypothetical protein
MDVVAPPSDAGKDASTPVDSGIDSGIDSGVDSGIDSGVDSGASVDGGGDAALTDAAVDAPAPGCSPSGSACMLNGTNALCVGTTCQACADPGDDMACSMAYGGGTTQYICNAGVCVAGDCHDNTQCASATPVCSNNKCIACDAANGTDVVVDPVNGVDAVGRGSGMAGGAANGACAFKTINFALGSLGTAKTVQVLGPTISVAANGEMFPINVPAGIQIIGQGTPTVSLGAGAIGFVLDTDASSVQGFIIDGTSRAVHGVSALPSATLNTNIGNLEIKGFIGAALTVASSAQLTINAGTNVHDSGGNGEPCGVHLAGGAHAVIAGDATAPIQFNNNLGDGILVEGAASITLTGTPGTGATGTVLAFGNQRDGIRITQVVGGAAPLNSITGLVAASNAEDGLRIFAGSTVAVRGSVFLTNAAAGIDIENGGTGATATSNVSAIDLGTASSAGKNVIQSTGTNANTLAGLAYNIAQGKSQTLNAIGNIWVDDAAASVDCSMTAGTLTEGAGGAGGRVCTGGVDLCGTAFSNVVMGTSNGVAVSISTCTCGGSSMTCQ